MNWVRNVRAASGEAVLRRRGSRYVRLEEVAPADRADVIAEYLHAGRRRNRAEANADQARSYFGLDPDPSIDDIRAIVENCAVCRVIYTIRSPASARQAGKT